MDEKTYQEKMMDKAKGIMGYGVASTAGLGAIGAMSNLPNMPSQVSNVTAPLSAGLALGGVGLMADVALNIVPKDTKKSTGDKKIDKMLGL